MLCAKSEESTAIAGALRLRSRHRSRRAFKPARLNTSATVTASAVANHSCVRCFSGHRPSKVEGKTESETRAKLADGPAINQGIAYGHIKRELVIHLPNGAEQGGVRLGLVENLVEMPIRPHKFR